MSPLRARVEKGRLVLDEPTTLPEGTELDLGQWLDVNVPVPDLPSPLQL
jgi:hypothetical protein